MAFPVGSRQLPTNCKEVLSVGLQFQFCLDLRNQFGTLFVDLVLRFEQRTTLLIAEHFE
jgi:hypothetical protein